MTAAPVVVVGAGIVGASVAYHLARDGVPVTVIARDAGVTASSFAWIGEEGEWPGGAADLRTFVLGDWRRLEAEVPGVSVRFSTPGDGGVDARAAARALLLAARGHGARTVAGATVTAVRPGGVASSVGWHPASTVVLAAGTGVGGLEPRVAVPASPALLLRLRGPAGLVPTVVATPSYEVRPFDDDGVLLATAPLGPDRSWIGLREAAGQAVSRMREAFGDEIRLTGWSVGERPMPAGGPIIGRLDEQVYVAVMHSGVCLGPVAGRLIASEIGSGRAAAELDRCRPRRAGGRRA